MRTIPMRKWAAPMALAVVWLALPCGAQTKGVPPFINYQGVLSRGDGVPLTNQSVTVDFRIYDAEKGGTMLWGTRQLVSTDSNGLFNASLGDEGENVTGATNQVASIADVFVGEAGDSRWLELEVEYNHSYAMSPRQRFLTNPYAYQAGNATGSRGDFQVGEILEVKSNTVIHGAVVITDAGEDALDFHGPITVNNGLTVSQQLSVASGAVSVSGPLNVHGPALFTNNVAFTEPVEFDGPAAFSNGVSFRGNTTTFGTCHSVTSRTGSGSSTGTVPTNGFLAVRFITTDTDENHNKVTFTLDGATQWLYRAHWDTDGGDWLHFKCMTLYPVKAGTAWSLNSDCDTSGYQLYYWTIP